MLKYNISTSEAVDFHFHLNRTNQKDYYKRAYVYNPSNNMSTTSHNVISSLSSVKSLGSICLNDRKRPCNTRRLLFSTSWGSMNRSMIPWQEFTFEPATLTTFIFCYKCNKGYIYKQINTRHMLHWVISLFLDNRWKMQPINFNLKHIKVLIENPLWY